MKEDFLHFLWKHQKFLQANLKTTQGYDLKVIKTGTHNMLAGPDFSDARLKIDDLDWVGNVEIHLKSSDWFAHRTIKIRIMMRLYCMWFGNTILQF